MSLLVPSIRDRIDAHGDLDEDSIYQQKLKNVSQEWEFSPVDQFFSQSNDDTNDMEFNYTTANFGVLGLWDATLKNLKLLNESSTGVYKLFFLARHGEGWHNWISGKYSKEEWMSKWRFLGTDGEIEWGPDAKLTPKGIDQAKENRDCWNDQISKGAPIPKKFYVSPLLRSLDTMKYTWESQVIPTPMVLENLRETIGVHLCHTRSPKSDIQKRFPNVEFEPGFTENDELADKYSQTREELNEQFLRLNGVLQEIFSNDDEDVISITSHAGTIRSLITVIGHRKFTICTGGMIPIVVRGVRTGSREEYRSGKTDQEKLQ